MSFDADQLVVCDYDPAWAGLFADLSAKIAAALRPIALRIEHVGSTAVQGLAAKPIIDLDVVLASSVDHPKAIHLLAALGYVHEG
ncbi:MAG: GrpB family protein, partial [Steroidobacteraceae bacterium]